MARPIVHVHSSGRHDRPASSVAAALHAYAARDRVDVLTLTEFQRPSHRAVLAAWAECYGYLVAQAEGPAGQCVVAVRASRFRLRRQWDDRLTGRPQNRAKPGAARHQALSVVVEDLAAGEAVLWTVAHLTAGVEAGMVTRPTSWRRRDLAYRVSVWLQARQTWGRRTWRRRRHHGLLVVMVADWNLNLERRRWRLLLRAFHPRLRLTWRRFPGPGTHGRRVIDGTLTNLQVVRPAVLLADDPSSDHRPYREVLAHP